MRFNEWWAETLFENPALKNLPLEQLNLLRTVSNNAWLNGLLEGQERTKANQQISEEES